MVDRSSSEKTRFVGLMLSGGRSPHTAICALDHFKGQGRLFLVESFVGKKEKNPADPDVMLVERLQSLVDDEDGTPAEIITNAPLDLPPCFKCGVYRCLGKDNCEVPETIKMMEVYEGLKQKKKNLKKFTPYTQRIQDVWIREAVPEVMPPHEAMGSNMAQITSRMIHIRKMMPGTLFKESYPAAAMYRILPSLGLPLSYAEEYRNIITGRRIRSAFIKKLEDKAAIFIYDNDMDILSNSVQLFDSLILAFTGVLGLLDKTEGPVDGFIVPINNIKF